MKIILFGFIALICLTISAAAQAPDFKLPKDIKLAPDLRVKEVKLEWFSIAGKGSVLQVTPIIQKNKADKITTKPGEPMIIFVGTMTESVLQGPTCKIEVVS